NSQPVILIGEEPVPPYQRPPLSKKYLLGQLDRERLFIRPQKWFDDQGITTRFGEKISSINPAQKTVTNQDGNQIAYSKLILTTGSRARQLPDHLGGTLDGVFTLRSIADIDRMAPKFTEGRKLLIIGGGYIGLEAAAVGRMLGLKVTLIEAANRILQRVAAQQTSNYFRKLHVDQGVDLRESAHMKQLVGQDGRVTGAELEDGSILDADLVLVGIGGIANTDLAEAAGLNCDNGVEVDDHCETSNPDIYAAGDCCSFYRNGQKLRLESVQNASDQGDLIARHFAGEAVSYTALPWFWSDQYGCKLQIVGLNQGHTHSVVRPGAIDDSQSIWYYKDDQLLAIDAMNDPKAYAFGRKIIAANKHPAPEIVSNPETDLKALAKE
ncbi:MAG: 3-phenylpropionate/trans-cinnamate dioxygenase ferredoxin reductase subunit, partial [Gammaproteobacteria bacterium]